MLSYAKCIIIKDMTIIKKNNFLMETGNFNKKTQRKNEDLESYLIRTTAPDKKVEETYSIFIDYHLGNGCKKRELGLDRTVVKLGRRKG